MTEGALTGDAAWKAHREELERRNAAAKRNAHDQVVRRDAAATGREQRLAQAEALQLQRLNERIDRNRRQEG